MSTTRFFCAAVLVCLLVPKSFGAAPASLSDSQQKFLNELAVRSRTLENQGAGAVLGVDGWFFLSSDLRFLSIGQFWGADAPKVSRSRKVESADPIPAIVDFQQQLKKRGIDLLILPVPSKAAIYPEKIVPDVDLKGQNAAPFLERFYDELRARGIDVVDLVPIFAQNRANEHSPVFCKTDSHWSGLGCVLAAQAIAAHLRERFVAQPRKNYVSEWKETEIKGDLIDLVASKAKTPTLEKIPIRAIAEKETGAAVQPEPGSPVLVLGDSHTLVFHDFHGEKAGLIDQMAKELGFAPDLIGTRGSGATAVRISLYRRDHKESDYLSKKKVIVWCFAAREFTESDQGWEKVPVGQ